MKKSKIAWITDTTASLSKEFIEQHHIHVIPLHVVINDEFYKETIDITEKEFYERMKNEEGKFQTSQPSINDFVELYHKLKEDYDCGIAIHASSLLTGTFQSSVMAADMEEFKLFAIDSQTGSYPLSHLIKKGVELENEGLDADEVVAQLNAFRDQTRLYLVPSNLDQLHKSGRVSGGQKILASLFNIKPILSIEEGAARIKDKVRTEKKAFAWLVNKLTEDLETKSVQKVAIVHANDLEKAELFEKLVNDSFPTIETEKLMLITVAGVHTGVGTLGLSWVCE
ncbi:DegV family protein [Neobacillus sp. MM2021_6]|uniref:DegV family protein n=1 Tax=Bacillaceae TaxID=186817 RepID=UPI001407238D|nr:MULTISPECIES: DegV family protein [Bacillaceae]MBO0961155.1 DegV family protein [Neobacillus sp. MM2021_6]NHC19334.1 DegV family protein [Bacillus sp. MM2020_4]